MVLAVFTAAAEAHGMEYASFVIGDLLALVLRRAPRGRSIAVDTSFYSPCFTLASLIGVSMSVVQRLLVPLQ